MPSPRVAIIGAGVAGLTAAIDLAGAGCEVIVLERAAAAGGKMREVRVGDDSLDAGPTVFTLRSVFDALFDDAGDNLDQRLRLIPATVLARHAWSSKGAGTLDLFADLSRSVDAIGDFAGAAAAAAFRRFTSEAERVYRTLDASFMRAQRPTPFGLMRRLGVAGLPDLWAIKPFATLWASLGGHFDDHRLRQLFGRYATYCGSSPFSCPATLMLVAHVEQAGVWYVEGGMRRLIDALGSLLLRRGATLRCRTEVRRIEVGRGRIRAVETAEGERIEVDAVVCNADNQALAAGLFGEAAARAVAATPPSARSLSAVTWNLVAQTSGFDLAHHSVFFSDDYAAEFSDIFARRRLPAQPTIYVCAQDRRDAEPPTRTDERLFFLINAPATGDIHEFNTAEMESCANRVVDALRGYGLELRMGAHPPVVTSPSDFNRLFPATGGALYGPASHGWQASFSRAGARSRVPGLYLAGGSTHPGPGVPMAATSGRLAAARILADFASTNRSRATAMSGGTSMR